MWSSGIGAIAWLWSRYWRSTVRSTGDSFQKNPAGAIDRNLVAERVDRPGRQRRGLRRIHLHGVRLDRDGDDEHDQQDEHHVDQRGCVDVRQRAVIRCNRTDSHGLLLSHAPGGTPARRCHDITSHEDERERNGWRDPGRLGGDEEACSVNPAKAGSRESQRSHGMRFRICLDEPFPGKGRGRVGKAWRLADFPKTFPTGPGFRRGAVLQARRDGP